MDELGVVKKLGIAKSSTINSLLDKSMVGTIRCLNTLEKFEAIKIVTIHYNKGTKRLYIKNEIYKDYFN